MKIGVTFTESNHINYLHWIKGKEDNIEIIELSYVKNNLGDVSICDAIVFTGGIDMEPTEKVIYPNAPEKFNVARDLFEMNVLEKSLLEKKPVLGICRGLQLINVFKGGTLYLDNGENKNKIHKKETEDKTHIIQVEKDSLFYSIVKELSGEVNSAHHQSIENLGADIKAVAYSYDGVIEAIESSNPEKEFILAVQWHPERMTNLESPFSKNLRKVLIEKIGN
ncbi:MAG: gamma-glutamyl-gamma-aminobutyrate hydrolase family protein [Flavobacterium sp.]|uniref:gamma-glutamyl-gamma-aminobutyrate hydrolase family protein n=1 Tax=Flavobacterium sp. TaxID=239 RepID=UPI002626345B|nr:gamma-glutamyl-gamma-aminobutyrate hydrolase family protein [Flavobacterium sp.]MDD5151375.1 gamma-glutamyl-gamma-aminobutyrate hydrolase family protein [Flavobacterium sp.]